MSNDAANLLRDARIQARLSQRQLARRARTAQSVVARIELGHTDPSWATLKRLLAAAGFVLTAGLDPAPAARSHMLDDVGRILALTPEARLAEARNLSRLTAAARRV